MQIVYEELTVPESARYLQVNEETIRRNIRCSKLRAQKRGTQWFINRDDLASFAMNYDKKTGKHIRLI